MIKRSTVQRNETVLQAQLIKVGSLPNECGPLNWKFFI